MVQADRQIGGTKMRKKSGSRALISLTAVMTFAAVCDVLSAFVNNYSVPYLLNTPGANLGAKGASRVRLS